MEKEWPDPVGDNRLTRYNIANWLRDLVAMRIVRKQEAAEAALAADHDFVRQRSEAVSNRATVPGCQERSPCLHVA